MADGTKIDPNVYVSTVSKEKKAEQQEEYRFHDVDLSKFHGFLLAKGNCVYVTANRDLDYENAAVERIKQNIKNLGYWTVVDKPDQAHFIFQYGVRLTGADLAFAYLKTRDGYKKYPNCSFYINPWSGIHPMQKDKKTECMIYSVESASEEVNDNIKVADELFDRVWRKVWAKKLSKEKKDLDEDLFEMFYIP